VKDEKERAASDAAAELNAHLDFHDPRLFRDLLGQHDQHIKILQQALDVRIRVRGSALEVAGDPIQVELASQIVRQLYGLLEKGYPVYASDVDYAIRILSGDSRAKLQTSSRHIISPPTNEPSQTSPRKPTSRHPPLRHSLRHRPGRAVNLSCNGDGRGGVDEE
jgi:phosphate starvation-inducible protein PhoH